MAVNIRTQAHASSDQLFINLSFPVRASIIVAGLTLVFDFLFWYISHSTKDALIFFGASAAASGATLAAVYAARTLEFQIRQQARSDEAAALRLQHELRARALDYASRWNEPQMEKARKVCREIVEMRGSGVKDIDELLSADDRELRIIHMLNFLEEMATAGHHHVADTVILRDVYGDAVLAVWSCMGQWAAHYRAKRGQPNAWRNLESLYRQWE